MKRFRSGPFWFLAATLLVLSCTWVGQGPASIALRHYGVPLVLLVSVILFAPRGQGYAALTAHTASGLPALMLFILLVGAGRMVSHGAYFANMSHDFWHADPLSAPDRRPVLPAVAYLLPPWPAPYAVVWYITFGAFFLIAWKHLEARGFTPLQRFAMLTASIASYLLIVPGYTEVMTFLVALLCWRVELTISQKCMAAAFMIGGHEIAGGFAMAFLAIEADDAERRDWLAVLLFLYAIYAVGYCIAAGSGLRHMLDTAMRPDAHYPLTALQLVSAYPVRCLIGIVSAYKIAWLLLPAGFFGNARTRLHGCCVLLAVPLVLLATDTSRVVQFGSLSMFAVAGAVWPRLIQPARRALTWGLLILPSICVGLNGMPAWGNGLYALYVLMGQRVGLAMGGLLG